MEFEVRLICFPGQLYGSVALLLTDYINIPKLLSIICKRMYLGDYLQLFNSLISNRKKNFK